MENLSNFMVVSTSEFRKWLKNEAGIDWSRVTGETIIHFTTDFCSGQDAWVDATIYYNDDKDNDEQELTGPPSDFLSDFWLEIKLNSIVDAVDKATADVLLFDAEKALIIEYTTGVKHTL